MSKKHGEFNRRGTEKRIVNATEETQNTIAVLITTKTVKATDPLSPCAIIHTQGEKKTL